jgi:uncharacterized protein YggE
MDTTPTPTPTRNRSTAGWMSIAAVAALAVGLLAGPALASVVVPRAYPVVNGAATDTNPEHTISVTGSGKVTVIPDMATINLGVVTERTTAKAARQDAAAAMTRVVDAVRKLGIADKDITTANVSLNPVYDYPNNAAPKIRGYQMQNTISIKVRDLTKLSDVVDNSVAAGATTVDGISFDVADRTAAEAQARETAVKDAKTKADTLANGLGVRVTGVASVAESVSTPVWYQPTMAAGAAAGDKAAQTPVLPGSTDVVITVQVAFLIP